MTMKEEEENVFEEWNCTREYDTVNYLSLVEPPSGKFTIAAKEKFEGGTRCIYLFQHILLIGLGPLPYSIVWACMSGPKTLVVLAPSDEEPKKNDQGLLYLESDGVVLMDQETHDRERHVLLKDLESANGWNHSDKYETRMNFVEKLIGPFRQEKVVIRQFSPEQEEQARYPIALREFDEDELTDEGRKCVKELLDLGHKRDWLLVVSRNKVVFDEELSDIDARCG